MGRTLHYSIEKINGKDFTDKEALTMYAFSKKSYSGSMKKLWTCENFWLDVYGYYPYWRRNGWNASGKGKAESWEQIDKRYKELADENKDHITITKQLAAENLICYNSGQRNAASGFTKVQGNEANALMVYMILIELSKAIPSAKIHLKDEGEFLFHDVYIRQGKVLPDIEDLQHHINRWTRIIALNSKTKVINEIRKECIKDLPEFAKEIVQIDESYANCAPKYLKECITKAKIISNIVTENWTARYSGGHTPINVFNLSNLEVEYWFKPELFCRRVNVEAYKDYGTKTWDERMMQGFQGEAYGLVPEGTEEADSYRHLGKMMKILQAAGIDKKQIQLGRAVNGS